MITKEVNRALQAQIQVLSPRNRKPKRSRAPNIDNHISQHLFSSKSSAPNSKTYDSDDDSYEASNALFEANMTVRPNSPMIQSDMEDMTLHQL